jgi:hypothetical protein
MPGLPTSNIVNEEAGGSPLDRDEHMTNEEGHDSSSRMQTIRDNMITMNRGGNLANRNGDLDR